MGRIQNELLNTASQVAGAALKVPAALTAVNEVKKKEAISQATNEADKKLKTVREASKDVRKRYPKGSKANEYIDNVLSEAQQQHDQDIEGATKHAQAVMNKNLRPLSGEKVGSFMPVMDQQRLVNKLNHLAGYKLHNTRDRRVVQPVKPIQEVKKHG